MRAVRTSGGGRRSDALRSRAARTLVALLGVSSIAVTAAAAEPLGPRDRSLPAGVFALGEGGLGSIDMLSLGDRDGELTSRGRDTGTSNDRRTSGGSGGNGLGNGGFGGDGFGPDGFGRDGFGGGGFGPASLGLGLDPAAGVPGFGDEFFASVIPAGLDGGTGIPAPTLRAYRAAAEVLAREAPGCGIDWALLAGIGRVEANHGRFGGANVSDQGVSVPRILGPRLDGSLRGTMVIRDSDGGTLDGDTSYDRAVGPMQFLPGTWKRWGSDGDRDGASNPQDIDDAALAAARYLCEGRSGLDDRAEAAVAVRRYNNSSSYVNLVLSTAEGYRTGSSIVLASGTPMIAPGPAGWDLPVGTVVGAGPLDPVTPRPSDPPSTPPSTPPSVAPTASPTPTSPPPSGTPTTSPTGSPTPVPSNPTVSPTGTPTTVTPTPTGPDCDPSPSAEPSAEPTVVPGGDPTVTPTCLPVEPSEPAIDAGTEDPQD